RRRRVEQERHRIGEQPVLARGDQQAKRMGADQRMLNLEPLLPEMRGLIHSRSSVGVARTGFCRLLAPFRGAATRPRQERGGGAGGSDRVATEANALPTISLPNSASSAWAL